MQFEILDRELKLGDVVAASGRYISNVYLYVVVGFTDKNVRVECLNHYGVSIKPEVVLVEQARIHFSPEMEGKYVSICKKFNINYD